MDPDLFFALGLVLLALTVPAIYSALTEGRAPRLAALVLMIGGGLVAMAVEQKPGGYRFNEVPEVLVGVASRLAK